MYIYIFQVSHTSFFCLSWSDWLREIWYSVVNLGVQWFVHFHGVLFIIILVVVFHMLHICITDHFYKFLIDCFHFTCCIWFIFTQFSNSKTSITSISCYLPRQIIAISLNLANFILPIYGLCCFLTNMETTY